MWYDCNNDVAPGYYLCYAESQDGVTWTKPLGRGTVGYKDIPASQTNLVIAGGGTVAYNPDAPADRRYALMQFHTGVVNETLGYYAYFSPDGYHWTQAGRQAGAARRRRVQGGVGPAEAAVHRHDQEADVHVPHAGRLRPGGVRLHQQGLPDLEHAGAGRGRRLRRRRRGAGV